MPLWYELDEIALFASSYHAADITGFLIAANYAPASRMNRMNEKWAPLDGRLSMGASRWAPLVGVRWFVGDACVSCRYGSLRIDFIERYLYVDTCEHDQAA